MVVAGRCYERSTRSFRPDARRLARGHSARPAQGSRLLRTAPVSERRCNHADHRSTRTTLEALTHHDVIKGGAAPIGGRRPFPVCMRWCEHRGGRASRHIGTRHDARGDWRGRRSQKASESGCSVDVEPGPLAAMARTMPTEHCSDPHQSRAGMAPLTSRRSVRGLLTDDLERPPVFVVMPH